MRIAVATSNQKTVDLHFGKTSTFSLYDVARDAIHRAGTVEVTQYCASDPTHSLHEQRFAAIARALKGCRAVVCRQIGDLPRMSLAEEGIQVYTAQREVDEALREAWLLFSVGSE